MKIGVDGGALCAERKDFLGTSIFSENLIRALGELDRENLYKVYTFCHIENNVPNIKYVNVKPKKGFMKLGIAGREWIRPSNIFLCLNQSLPNTEAKIISFNHGLSYIKYPEHYKESFNKFIKQLEDMVQKSNVIVTSSVKVNREIKKLYPKLQIPLIALPFGVPYDFQSFQSAQRKKYFLFVGANLPIKRREFIVDCFQELIKEPQYSKFRLYLVGQHNIYNSAKNIRVMPSINRDNLKKLYQSATSYLSASYYESFNFPIIEALSQNCPVITMRSAVIDEMKNLVEVANDKKQFIELMKIAADGKMSYNYSKEVNERFNWKHYVSELKKIYETLSHRTH